MVLEDTEIQRIIGGPPRLTLEDIARLRKLLIAAEDAGLVRLHARGGRRVEILPRFWSSYDRGLASGMYIHDIAYVAASRMHLTPGAEREVNVSSRRSAN